jgi:hypothetical protein
MGSYRVTSSSGGHTIEADGFTQDDRFVHFYRGSVAEGAQRQMVASFRIDCVESIVLSNPEQAARDA